MSAVPHSGHESQPAQTEAPTEYNNTTFKYNDFVSRHYSPETSPLPPAAKQGALQKLPKWHPDQGRRFKSETSVAPLDFTRLNPYFPLFPQSAEKNRKLICEGEKIVSGGIN